MSDIRAPSRLIYSLSASLDGFMEDEQGNFDWGAPDDEVHSFINDQLRPVGTYLFGRRMYETMAVWDTMEDEHPAMREFAEIWRSADKIIYSRTLDAVTTRRTRLEREFDPDAILRLKESAERDIEVGGPSLAVDAFRAGIVDEVRLFVVPVVVGGGKPALPRGVRLDLELLEERRFAGGTVYLRYRCLGSG